MARKPFDWLAKSNFNFSGLHSVFSEVAMFRPVIVFSGQYMA
jgi:hypothetical protein